LDEIWEHCEHIDGGWPWQILHDGAVATVREAAKILRFFVT